MTNFKTGPKQDPKNLAQLVKNELEAVTQEAVNQVTVGAEEKERGEDRAKSVTKSPPLPFGEKQEANLASGQEAAGSEEELRRVRARLLALNEESALAREKLSREREEIAQKRNPVVEGVGSNDEKDNDGQAGQDDDSLPPFQAASRPKRGLPPWMVNQPERRQRR